jgi:hypothetical protein
MATREVVLHSCRHSSNIHCVQDTHQILAQYSTYHEVRPALMADEAQVRAHHAVVAVPACISHRGAQPALHAAQVEAALAERWG